MKPPPLPAARTPLPFGDWLRHWAARTPRAPALVADGMRLDYAALAAAVAQRAAGLKASGLNRGERVALAASRRAATVIDLLAAVDVGLCYVPLDPAYPDARLAAMLEDAMPRATLGGEDDLRALEGRLGPLPRVERPRAHSTPHAGEGELAYVLFTSGSSGRPKGVAMGPRVLAHLIDWHAAHPRLGRPAVTALFAPLSFDVHFQEIFSTLACGGCMVLLSEAERRDPEGLRLALVRERVQRLFLPYVALQMLAEACADAEPPPLLDVISAGEQLQITDAIRRLFARLPGSALHNHYGPTESHVVTAFELEGEPSAWPAIPPIGRALPHVRTSLAPLADDDASSDSDEGELLLGGDTLAAGYLRRAELSAERFIESEGGRHYRTGDRVRADADGVLHYLGRIDAQLKIDGYRVEPGEIEVALLAHPALRDAAVGACEPPGLGRQLAAWVVAREAADGAALIGELREHLRSRLPAYLQPLHYVLLPRLPTTPSGKIDRARLPAPAFMSADGAAGSPGERLLAMWRDALGRPQLGEHDSVFAAGARSLTVLRVVALARASGLGGLSAALVYDHPSVAGQAAALEQAMAGSSATESPARTRRDPPTDGRAPIAIIGWALRAPGCSDVEQFWQRLLEGFEGIRRFERDELDATVPRELVERPNFVAARGVLEDAARFDAAFFGVPKSEALLLDPQQRLLLELAWTALEDAAVDPQTLAAAGQRVGVYAGTANNSYAVALRAAEPERVAASGEFALMLASEKDYAATRIAHRLDLRGPAVSVHTACSTGLVAIAEAVQALRAGRCELALAGGASVLVPQAAGYLHVEGGMESADGRCRPFDAQASGTVFSSAGALVLLKRLDEALADGDTVHAVIRGVGVNNDGAGKASFTAPSAQGQAECIRQAVDDSGLAPGSIGYVEAHGTGTALGDPIEVEALRRVYGTAAAPASCVLGSLKSNFGHTIAAAGALGLIKAALCLEREHIPGTLHFGHPNPQIDFAATPFRVSASGEPWPRGEQRRAAAVSSFGVGGTNAHIVLEEPPPRPARAAPTHDDAPRLFVLSARSAEALEQRTTQLADALERDAAPLDAVIATLVRGRNAMPFRRAISARDRAGLLHGLRQPFKPEPALIAPRLVFLLPGQGSQHPGMAAGLYAGFPAFAEALDAVITACQPRLDVDLRALLLHAGDATAAALLAETRYAQPALYCMQVALAQWLGGLGLRPAAMIGHSIGEYAAGAMAGVLRIEDMARAVCARAAAMWAQPRGSMLAVNAEADALSAYLGNGIEIVSFNAPRLCVLAGPTPAIEALEATLGDARINTTRLKVSHAFHSAMMEGALPAVQAALAELPLQAPTLPVYSCVSGAPLRASEATDPGYWARQVRAPVRFSEALARELAQPGTVLLELGPGQALTALARQHRDADARPPRVVPLLPAPGARADAALHALDAIGRLWCDGIELRSWALPRDAPRARLPTYPFADSRYWFKPAASAPSSNDPTTAASATPPAVAQESAMADRRPALAELLRRLLADVAGLEPDDLVPDQGLVEQGLDSLSLTQASLEIERVFGLRLRFRRLMEDLDSVDRLVEHLHAELPPEHFAPAPAPAPAPAATATATAALDARAATPQGKVIASVGPSPGTDAGVLGVIQQQMALMQQHLAMLTGSTGGPTSVASALSAASAPSASSATSPSPASEERADLIAKPFGASARITVRPLQQMTDGQRAWLADFTARYLARSGKSRTFSQAHRSRMADPRVVTGFNPLWKDLVYPIVADRSDGARVWDIDGNDYIDLLSGFGANLLGYRPEALTRAMHEQLDRGIEVGPQHPLAAEVAALIGEFTGHERIGFCNTGSEAVMGAMRIARTVTGRKTIAIFTNSYHGIFDEVIVRGTRQLRSLSAAPGILANAVENILVLDYASDEALSVLRERGHELAAIMIEPIQNKAPTLQPKAFVRELRTICDTHGCALIFDEVVTGFRLAPGGAQQFYAVRADLCTYGKIIGGGLPFAAIAGSPRWMDALDGGHWQYGDDSFPEAGVTYFAGTFVRHPLALAAARATLLELKRGGQAFYDDLNARTSGLVERLNAAFAARGAPVKAVHCASLWRLAWDEDQKFVSLFYYLARFHGLHLYEQFGHFVTAAMGPAELERIAEVFIAALDELMAQGFIAPRAGFAPQRVDDARLPTLAGDASALEGPLGPGQAERWLAAGFDPNALRALDETFTLTLEGALDRSALETAVRDVCGRHPAFRLRIAVDAPRQSIDADTPAPIEVIALDAHPDPASALQAALAEAAQRRFTLGKAPMVALRLVWLGPQRAVLHVIASHLVFDGWAASVFVAELAARYRALSTALAGAPLPPAGSPIAFAHAEQARMAGPEGRASAEYWRQALASPPAPLALGDRQPQGARSFAADTAYLRIEGARFAALQAMAKAQRVTLFQLLLGAVATLLGRRGGTDDFVLSIPYAAQGLGRHPALLADGVLDLPLRLRLASHHAPLANLASVRSALMDALEHPLMTQGLAARLLGLPSRGEHPPLTGVYFNLNPKVALDGFKPLVARMQEGRKPGLLGELMFNFYEEDDALALDLHHSTEFFSPVRIAEILGELDADLERLAAATVTGTPTAATPVARPVAPTQRVEKAFVEQAARTPEAIAITDAETSITYAELDARANRIANALIARGVRVGDWVGLCLPRGIDLVAALLGVLKCGAAYVPLDPAFPLQRLRDMAEDAGLALLLSDAENTARLDIAGLRTLRLDHDAAGISNASANAPDLALPHDAPAYVIYTSGSTGKPKGVVVLQRGVVNFLCSMAHTPGLKAGERLLAVTTLSFDIAVLELLLPLTVGAGVVLAQRTDAIDGHALKQLIAQHGVHLMQATPSTWHLLLEAGFTAPEGFRALCGGEALSPALAKRLLDAGVTELWNMYGPTETTVWSTLARITDPQQISVGRPIDATVIRLLDEQNRECGVGEPGEICIGGAGVAQGYHARPELTAERFIADPFDATPGARLYRTGDLGAWNADGTIRHMGRLDHQVKLRGYRIELGEIEAALEDLPGIARAAMTVETFGPMDDRLVAHVVAAPGSTLPDLTTLRRELGRRLPDYMLPQVLRVLEAMPQLPNGKIDRKALGKRPSGDVAASPAPSIPPNAAPTAASPTMATIGEEMGRLLQRAALTADEHFFALGGHSLLAAELASALQKRIGIRPSLRQVFEAPTPAGLARALAATPAEATGSTAPTTVTRRTDRTRAPLSVQQLRAWFLELTSSDGSVNLLPSAHRLKGPFDRAAFQRALEALVARQSILRTVFGPSNDGAEQQVLPRVAVHCPVEDLGHLDRSAAEQAVYSRVAELQSEPIDLAKGPPFRAALFRIADDEHIFAFVVHHLAWDGWSFDLLYTDLAAHYAAEVSPGTPAPPPLALEYADFSAWQPSALKSAAVQAQLAHWRERLLPLPAPLTLPIDFERPASMSGRGDSVRLVLPPDILDGLHAVARRHGTTVFVILLATYVAMIRRLSGQSDVVVGTPVRGREQAELLPIMGFFVNALPLRFRDTPTTFDAWIRTVQAVVTDALGNPDVPIESLVRELSVPRDPSRPPLFQTMFSFQDVRQRPPSWGPLEHSRVGVPVTGSSHELSLWCVETRVGLETIFTFASDLLTRERVEAWAQEYLAALERASGWDSDAPSAMTAPAPARPVLRRRADQQDAPLTPMQARLVFAELTTPGGSANVVPSARRLRGQLDVEKLRQALQAMQARHSILRTIFVPSADGMRQRVLAEGRIELPLVDLSHLAPEVAESTARTAFIELQSAAFDLGHAPLLRAALYRISRDEHLLALVPHHVIWDGRSNAIFYRDLGEAYDAAMQRRPPRLPAMTFDFADYATSTHEHAAGSDAQQRMRPWLARLDRPPAPLELPLSTQRPAVMSGRADSVQVQIDPAAVARLREHAGKHGTTLFVLVLASYFNLLRGLTGQSDIVVGMPVHGRDERALAAMIGPFANILPVRLQAPDGDGPIALLDRVHARVGEALSSPRVPIDALVNALGLPRNAQRAPLFQTLVSYLDVADVIPSWGSLDVSVLELPLARSDSELGLWCTESKEGLRLTLSFAADLLDRRTTSAWLAELVDTLLTLPGPIDDQVAGSSTPAKALPASDHVRLLRDIWIDLLGHDAITVDDNFFELGGHSLLALTMVSRVELACGKRLPLLRVGDSSLGALATLLDDAPVNPTAALPEASGTKSSRWGGWLRRIVGKTRS